ncbi:MAG: BrnT family toxin [Blastocatellia bacterium]
MRIDDFIWLPNIVEKLDVKHQVSQDEVEEVFFNRPRFRFVESGNRRGEDVYSASGQTAAGRYLIVFFILKSSNTALIISARDMDQKERKLYERK